jgi:hypothetical protein
LTDYYKSKKDWCKKCVNRASAEWVRSTPNAQLSCKLRSRIKTKIHCEKLTGLPLDKFNEWLDFTKRYYVPKDYTGPLHMDHQYPVSHYDLSNEEHVAHCYNWKHLRYWTSENNRTKSNSDPTPLDKFKQLVLAQMFAKKISSTHILSC